MERARLDALARRTAHATDMTTILAARQQITDTYPDPRLWPPQVRATYDRLAAQLRWAQED